jgi:O-antigen ligase
VKNGIAQAGRQPRGSHVASPIVDPAAELETDNSVPASVFARVLEFLAAILMIAAFWSIQALIGGTRLLFALPAYGLLSIAGILCIGLIRKAKPLPDTFCLGTSALFFGYILGRAFFSPSPDLARLDACAVLAGLTVYLLASCVLTSPRTRLAILSCLLVAAMAHVFVGAIQFRFGNNFMPIPFLQRFDYGPRASGFYVCPNHLAGLLEVVGIFGLSIACWSRWPLWSKLLVGGAALVCYAGIVLTGSRGGFLSAGASLLVFGLLSLGILRVAGARSLVRIGATAFVVTLLAVLALVWVFQKSDFLADRVRSVRIQEQFRMDLWQAALKQWRLSPAIGTGSGTYLFYGRKFRNERMQSDPIYAHNDYLQLLSEYGAIGLITFLAFFLVHCARGWIDACRLGPKRVVHKNRLTSNAMALNIGALTAVTAIAVHSIVDFNLHIPANVLLMAFVFGTLANSGTGLENDNTKTFPSLIAGRFFLVGIAILLGLCVWRFARGEYYAERARTAIRDHRPLAGMGFARKGLAFEQHDPLLFYYLGLSQSLAADSWSDRAAKGSFYDAALHSFEKARQLAPLDKTYFLELAFTYDALGRFDEAEWMFQAATALDPRATATREYYAAHLKLWQSHGSTPAAPEKP